MNKQKDQILKEIILAYRNVISDRYTFENLKKRNDFPEIFTQKEVEEFKNYFLSIYPLPDKREELNDAFENLNNYIKHPNKLLRILLDSSRLLFKYGRHLPKILSAGMKAMKSLQAADDFENKLVEQAIELEFTPPFSQNDIQKLIKTLSIEEIEEFIGNNIRLFETLYDKALVSKIEDIVEQLIDKMKSRPEIYQVSEIRGLEIGQEIIVQGNLLFENISKKDQEKIFEFVIKIEREILDGIFG